MSRWFALISMVFCLQSVASVRAMAADQQARDLLTAAKHAYELSSAVWKRGAGQADDVYRWSLRWLKAANKGTSCQTERAKAANRHVRSMENVLAEAKRRREARSDPAQSIAAPRYYVAKAKAQLPNAVTRLAMQQRNPDDLATLANEAYEWSWNEWYVGGKSDPETLYLWSIRSLSESKRAATSRSLQVAAASQHLQRMEKLFDSAKLAHDATDGPRVSLAAARYYLTAAKLAVGSSANATKTSGRRHQHEELMTAAKDAYEWYRVWLDLGVVHADELHRWSTRWMNAASKLRSNRHQKVAIANEHLQRMQAVLRHTKTDAEEGSQDADVAAAAYYVTEARVLLSHIQCMAGP